ncbi:hypothetical protein [Phyllobacterium leguminum]|uniref:Uncharacterized protein n=1 Tax=Phyllobacterium leguminum TaxID=314237 RepID=A0A318TDW7_9HYPH|nr:hypothetical protein [Phyllobacterium leguminum]PYE89566.1 hypothetical protein C7477_10374 [Phyllobacterium leguminum]
MKLAPDWKRVLRRAWSVRLILLAGILSGVEVALPLIGDAHPIPTGVFAGVSLLVTAAAFVARIVAQKEFNDE